MSRSLSRGVVAWLLPFALAACGRVPLDLAGGTSSDATLPVTTGSAGTNGAAGASGATCKAGRCGGGQVCCILNGTCISPSRAAIDCPRPTSLPSPGIPDAALCGSNADCASTQFCGSNDTCLGPGQCMDRSNCGTSTGPPVCGCDGVTYKDVQTACLAGTTTLGRTGACGVVNQPGSAFSNGARQSVTYCGTDNQCPAGQKCCAIYGTCLDTSVPDLCTFPPAGASRSCVEDVHCHDGEFCQGAGCSGPGGCVFVDGSMCTGVLDPVCGCDGKTYTNEGCTFAAGVRTAHTGSCETP
jgi:hypothetical protein